MNRALFTLGVVLISAATGCGTAAPQTPTISTISATASPQRATVGPTPQPQTTTASPPTRTGSTTVTVADDGVVLFLGLGQSVTVVLNADGPFSWHVPTVAGTAVSATSAGGGYPGAQPAMATFDAVQPGTVTLTAYDDIPCLHSHPPCLPPQRMWRATVVVR